jgi:two-component system nitrogen regulation sensor histidine kinase NtrY
LNNFINRHIFLLLAFGFLLASLVYWKVYNFDNTVENQLSYVASVSKSLNYELDKAQIQSDKIKHEIQHCKRPTFSRLTKSSPYPYFVFRNGNLYYWSVNSFFPKRESLQGNWELRFVVLQNGAHMVKRDVVLLRGDLFEIFFFIPLSTEYPVDNKYLHTHLNSDIFYSRNVGLLNQVTQHGGIYSSQGDFLFSIVFPSDESLVVGHGTMEVIALAFLGLIFLLVYLNKTSIVILKKYGAEWSLLFLLGTLVLVRAIMLWSGFPFGLIEDGLFSSKYFASSFINPSLGDLSLNLIFLLAWMVALGRSFSHTRLYNFVSTINKRYVLLVKGIVLFLCFFSFYYLFWQMLALYTNSQWEVDITESLDFDVFRLVSIGVCIILLCLFTITIFVLSRFFLIHHKNNDLPSWILLFVVAILFAFSILFLGKFYFFIILLDILFFVCLLYFRFPKMTFEPKYGSYFFLLFTGLVCALAYSYAVFINHQDAVLVNKQKFATQLLVKNDVLGEYLLNETSNYIDKDLFIQSVILNPFVSKESIKQKIKRVYLGQYFDKYDVKVHLFDALGFAYDPNQEFIYWPEVINSYKKSFFQTEYPHIYLMHDPGRKGFNRYLVFKKLRKHGSVIGFILIELKQKRIQAHSVYPELLVDKSLNRPWEKENYSYAIFGADEIQYSYGQYNYEGDFNAQYFEQNEFFEKGIVVNQYHHLGVKSNDGNVVIISSQEQSFYKFFSNFSFFYMIFIFVILIFILIWSFNIRFRKIEANFSTKIQIYLNLAFFIPLSVVSITTLSIISSSYKKNLNETFVKKAEAVSNYINLFLQNEQETPSANRLQSFLIRNSRFMDADINLFDKKGRLVYTNQPLIYEAGLMSGLINPLAYSTIVDNKNNVFMLSEKVGSFSYNSVYIAIKSYENAKVLGILSIPFFGSKQELDQQLIEVLTTILNIFVSIFLVFLLISYLVSKWLTVPLELITQKLKRTTLGEKNEPLEWESKDEIGLLVGEYNKMLVKLEESKEALSKSEKESAWREMAQQVAHEIKNPLTPMKLSIQHLQRAIASGRGNLQEMGMRTLQLLLDQVDTLTEIATSFSVFAKMPIPKNDRFDFGLVVKQIYLLHKADKNIEIDFESNDLPIWVNGDKQLLGSILSNLILNAVQSVPANRTAKLDIELQLLSDRVIYSLKDNGEGIDESVRDKIFIPNFSTKYSGSGLGLAIAKRGVEHAGGKIWFETIQGEGSTFFIELPLIE